MDIRSGREISTVAMYLPQFHRIPENDRWWGEGFTDWVTVKNARPLRDGHRQPIAPLGGRYYDLTEKETMMWQAGLAEEYGIDGFCFYHYRFGDGEMLLERPAENLLGWKDIPMKFCFCWANETWARSWSAVKDSNPWADAFESEGAGGGSDTESSILIEQRYGDEESWDDHFAYLMRFFRDERYITVDGKPLMLIYKPELIDCLGEMTDRWRSLAEKERLPGLYIIGLNMTAQDDHLDAALISAPAGYIDFDGLEEPEEGGRWTDAASVWERGLDAGPVGNMKTYYGAFAGYDDSPRRGKNGIILGGNSPEVFRNNLVRMMRKNLIAGNDIQFINAWNEWGEGNMLEPDETYGYSFLEAVREVTSGEEHLTEKQYMLRHFDETFCDAHDGEVWLYGTGANAQAIYECSKFAYAIKGFIAGNVYGAPEGGGSFLGKPVIDAVDLVRAACEGRKVTVIIAANIRSAFEIYERDGEKLCSAGIEVRDMYGNDMHALLRDARGSISMSDEEWAELFAGYDMISFDLMDTFLLRDVFDEGSVYIPPLMKRLYRLAADGEREVAFVCGSELDAAKQKVAICEAGIRGCDIFDESGLGRDKLNGLFRIMALRNKGKKILHIGNDLLCDLIAPKMYGIDSFLYGDASSDLPAVSGRGEEESAVSNKEDILKAVEEHEIISFDLFDTLITRVVRDHDAAFRALPDEYIPLRKEAQKRLDEPTIYEIYDEMQKTAGFTNEERDRLLSMEIDEEKRLLRPCGPVIEILERAQEIGRKVIIVSDMYLPAPIIGEILSENGLQFDLNDIYVSCEHRKRKQAGLLEEAVLHAGGGSRNVLHIGDSAEHDGWPCRKAGFDCKLLPGASRDKDQWMDACVCALEGTAAEEFAAEVMYRLREDPFTEPAGWEKAVALAAVFTVWLVQKAEAKRPDAMLFASRDGYIIEQVYRHARTYIDTLPEPVYLHTSRMAAFALKDDTDMRQSFFRYLGDKGLSMGRRYGFVDLYAAGQCQRLLEGICPFTLEGYYFGLNETNPAGDIEVSSLLGSLSSSFLGEHIEAEKLFSSDEPMVCGYSGDGPVFCEEERTPLELDIFRENEDKIMTRACGLLDELLQEGGFGKYHEDSIYRS